MKFISWNIDSINAALTSTSARSELSRNVLEMIKQEDADIIAIQETKLPEAGLTDKEREGFSNLLSKGFVDSFRYLNGNVEGIYSWWSQRIKTSKINNSGWRIDYFLLSDRIKDKALKSSMLDSGQRQDHTPLILEISNF